MSISTIHQDDDWMSVKMWSKRVTIMAMLLMMIIVGGRGPAGGDYAAWEYNAGAPENAKHLSSFIQWKSAVCHSKALWSEKQCQAPLSKLYTVKICSTLQWKSEAPQSSALWIKMQCQAHLKLYSGNLMYLWCELDNVLYHTPYIPYMYSTSTIYM